MDKDLTEWKLVLKRETDSSRLIEENCMDRFIGSVREEIMQRTLQRRNSFTDDDY